VLFPGQWGLALVSGLFLVLGIAFVVWALWG
jgi:hypothetical protein